MTSIEKVWGGSTQDSYTLGATPCQLVIKKEFGVLGVYLRVVGVKEGGKKTVDTLEYG